MNCRASSSLSGYSIQLISCPPFNTAARQRPKPASIVPLVVIRIGSVTNGFVSRASSLNSSSRPIQPSSSSARCSRSCSEDRTTGRPSGRLITRCGRGSSTTQDAGLPRSLAGTVTGEEQWCDSTGEPGDRGLLGILLAPFVFADCLRILLYFAAFCRAKLLKLFGISVGWPTHNP